MTRESSRVNPYLFAMVARHESRGNVWRTGLEAEHLRGVKKENFIPE